MSSSILSWLRIIAATPDRAPEPAHPEQRPRLHGPERQPEPVGDLRLREAVEVHQLDDLALFGGELVERGSNRPAFLGQPDLVDDILGRVRLDDRVRELGLLDAAPLRLLAAHGVDGAVMDHAHQPCTDGPALRVVAARVPPHRQERLLHDLLREERLPDDAARECHGARRVPSEQSSEGFAVATADPLDELPVSGVGEVGRHGNLP